MLKPEDIIGVWRLVSYEMEDAEGVRSTPFGDRPVGRLVYTAGGIMSAHLGADDRPGFNDLGESNAERALGALRSHFSYSGRWRIEGDDAIHDVDLSIFPDWVGGQQVRRIAFDGDEIVLSFETSEPRLGRKPGRARLRWRREE